jgi:hypothetical protein
VVFLCITYGLTLAVALALPHAGITSLIAIAFPVIAMAHLPSPLPFHVVSDVRSGRRSDSTRGEAVVC